MKKLLWVCIILVASVLMLFVAGGVLFYFVALQDNIEQTTGPVTREQALKHCPIELPLGAHHIQYARLAAGLQEYWGYVRFEAPVSECHSYAESILSEESKKNPQITIPQFLPVSHPHSVKCDRLQVEWFDTERIINGVVAGEGGSHQPIIWIDEERGIFYYYVTD